MKVFSVLCLAALLSTMSGCGDSSKDFIEQYFQLIYEGKATRNLNNRMTEWMREDMERKQVGIYSGMEQLAEKFRSHRILDLSSKSYANIRAYYGLIEEVPRRGNPGYRTFVAKFVDSEQGYLLYDMIVVNGRHLDHAVYLIDLLMLRPETIALIQSIQSPVNMLLFSEQYTRLAIHLAKEFAAHNLEQLSIESINPRVESGTASSYGIGRDSYIVLEQEETRYRLKMTDMFQIKQEEAAGSPVLRYFDGERMLGMALARITADNNKLLFVSGLGERSIGQEMKQIEVSVQGGFVGFFDPDEDRQKIKRTIEDLNVVHSLYKELAFSGFSVFNNPLIEPEEEEEKEEADTTSTTNAEAPAPFLDPLKSDPILIFADPRKSLSTEEQTVLDSFLEKGGRAVFLFDKPLPGSYQTILSNFGLAAYRNNLMVVDPAFKEAVQGPSWFEASIPVNKITANYERRVDRFDPMNDVPLYFSVLLPETLGFYALTNVEHKFEHYTLLSTSTNGWAESEFEPRFPDDVLFSTNKDIAGPIHVGKALAGKRSDGPRVLVFGDCDFISDAHLYTRFSNWLFFRDMLHWLDDPALFFLPMKSLETDRTLGLGL